ncbi:MAG: hypothetical protein HETSPECPRED_004777 [Heterodermia speciosa]|uniref:Phosphoribulokinase/uridine kinase domain-containing protein n=1 Tax=Heterodermia speciosa TaxID=116794 RepID=A0A8H3EFN2_9LECA|nr:MAG: hypothetical protein HETSPECPRED_004777 [Heterodermia speciosa]
MEDQVDRLVRKTWEKYQQLPTSKRFLIAVAGIPGSGKTTLASIVASRLNALHAENAPAFSNIPIAAFIPLDGYHLTRSQLSALPDPSTAHARRGAAFTFDASAYLALVKKLRAPICPESKTIYAPSFDHAVKDPIADDIPVAPTIKVCVFEGNYVALNKDEWAEATLLMDEIWWVEVDENVARERLVRRHVKAGIAKDEEEAGQRADENDLVNGREIIEGRVDIVREWIVSREDEGWKPEAHKQYGKPLNC